MEKLISEIDRPFWRASAEARLQELRAEVERLKDKYETCEQCDGSTDAGVLCVPCWNRVHLQVGDLTISERGWRATAEDAESQVNEAREILRSLCLNAAPENHDAWTRAMQFLGSIEKPKCECICGAGFGLNLSCQIHKPADIRKCVCGCHVGGEGSSTACGCCLYPR